MSEMLYPTVDEGDEIDDTTEDDLKYIQDPSININL